MPERHFDPANPSGPGSTAKGYEEATSGIIRAQAVVSSPPAGPWLLPPRHPGEQRTASGRILEPGEVVIEDGVIVAIRELSTGSPVPALLTAGFVDLQVNGHGPVDVATCQGDDWRVMENLLLAQGVTTWCPTLSTLPPALTAEAIERLAGYTGENGRAAYTGEAKPPPAPDVAGIHLEGPFLGGMPGAHRPEWLRPIDLDWLAALTPDAACVTLSPELAGAAEAATLLASRGILVGIGHTAAGYEATSAVIGAGAQMATHCFNAFGPWHHRDPGALGAVLTDDRVVAALIADPAHLHPAAIMLAYRAKGPTGIALITDAAAEPRDGAGRRGNPGSVGRGSPGGIGSIERFRSGVLAGSHTTMNQAVAYAVAAGVPLMHALGAASVVPAGMLGLADRGALAPGCRADVVALDPGNLDVVATWVAGALAWERGSPSP